MTESAAMLADEVFAAHPIRQWVLSVPYPLRLLLAREPDILSKVLRIVYRAIAGFLIKHAGHKHKTAATGAVTVIQRFGSALNLNIHFHMLFPDGVFVKIPGNNELLFKKLPTLSQSQIQGLTERIAHRVIRYLEKQGIIERDEESIYLTEPQLEDDALSSLQGHAVTYRIAVGPKQGEKVLTLKTLPPHGKKEISKKILQGGAWGFSLHAGVSAGAKEIKKKERLCRYITRSAVAMNRLSLTNQGKVRYALKNPYHDGTTHVIFEPLDFIAKLAALVPSAKVNLTRFHGVFAPNSKYRSIVVKQDAKQISENSESDPRKKYTMTWMERLKCVFKMDISVCEHCRGNVKVIAWIENQATIDKILNHIQTKSSAGNKSRPPPRAPPQYEWHQ